MSKPALNNPKALLVDLYELTMVASYFDHKRQSLASFELFIRNMPSNRSFLVAAGIQDAIDYIVGLRFDEKALRYLKSLKLFSPVFLRYLKNFHFTGDVWGMDEGTVFFPNEPVLRVVGPIIEAQILESCLLNTINIQTTIASKAARICLAAGDKSVLDFSLRRTHGMDAANKVARASYLTGFGGTSNVLAGYLYGMPVSGTMAHSYVMAHDSEEESFRFFARGFPEKAILLVDTYDTLAGVHKAVKIAKEMEDQGHHLKGIRLDSGDLAGLAKRSRKILDKAGLRSVKIFVSGNLDEYKIRDLLKRNAPIDGFGVGTKMGVSADAPYCDVIYKLCEITDQTGRFLPTMKLSSGKFTYPGRKQVYRFTDKKGRMKRDVLGLEKEKFAGAKPLLKKIVREGKRIRPPETLETIRRRTMGNLDSLPSGLKQISRQGRYPLSISRRLNTLTKDIARRLQQTN